MCIYMYQYHCIIESYMNMYYTHYRSIDIIPCEMEDKRPACFVCYMKNIKVLISELNIHVIILTWSEARGKSRLLSQGSSVFVLHCLCIKTTGNFTFYYRKQYIKGFIGGISWHWSVNLLILWLCCTKNECKSKYVTICVHIGLLLYSICRIFVGSSWPTILVAYALPVVYCCVYFVLS